MTTYRQRAIAALLMLAATSCTALLGIPNTIGFGDAKPDDGGADHTGSELTPDTSTTPPAEPRGPRCNGLGKICGLHQDEDCCASSVVEGGTFYRSYDGLTGQPYPDSTSYPATVPSFELDTFEVTVARFRAFAAEYTPPSPDDLRRAGVDEADLSQAAPDRQTLIKRVARCQQHDSTWTDQIGLHEAMPINCVSWFDAFSFCAWDGGRLPYEVEWNYAAAGGDEHRLYPWSDLEIDPDRAIYSPDGGEFTEPELVGFRPDGQGRWGQMDMAGNLAEWVMDWLAPYSSNCDADCVNLVEADPPTRVLRGGSFAEPPTLLRAAYRNEAPPANHFTTIGFRCMRPLAPVGDAGPSP
jgi:formylglycine-generating enzyme required for sulfatase activity